MVYAAFEGRGRGRAADGEVPFEQVCFEGRSVVVWRGRVCELGGFFEDAFDGGIFGGELAGGGHGGGMVVERVTLLCCGVVWYGYNAYNRVADNSYGVRSNARSLENRMLCDC